MNGAAWSSQRCACHRAIVFIREAAISRIGFIRQAQQLGFTLNEIGELMELEADAKANCGVVRTRAVDKIAAVERKISDLVRMKEALEGLASSCDGNRPMSECPLMDCLSEPTGIGTPSCASPSPC